MDDSSQRPIVVVDDNEDDVFFFKRLLNKAGVKYRQHSLPGGDEAVSFLAQVTDARSRTDAPLVCFLDVKMLGTNGFDVLKWIRRQAELDNVPVVMLSSSDDDADLRKSAKLGAQCYLRKHPNESDLRKVIAAAVIFGIEPETRSKHSFDAPFNLLARKS